MEKETKYILTKKLFSLMVRIFSFFLGVAGCSHIILTGGPAAPDYYGLYSTSVFLLIMSGGWFVSPKVGEMIAGLIYAKNK